MKPAEHLLGLTVGSGWTVIDKLVKKPGESGGHFSTGYIVEAADGKKAFLKAIDFSVPPGHPDPARFLQELTEAFNFERDILQQCKDDRLRRVVVAIEDGRVDVPAPHAGLVQFLIFELAEGTLHHRSRFAIAFQHAWSFRVAHHVATGLWQVHKQNIAHQDLKFSNVLVFNGTGSKIGDFGRASLFGKPPMRHDALMVAGDRTYAPPEQLYGHVHSDWRTRRFGCDMYLLGSLLFQMFTNVPMTGQWLSHLHRTHHPGMGGWGGTYVQVLPYVRDAMDRAIVDAQATVPEPYRDEFFRMVRELCEPELEKRGHPRGMHSPANQYSMERYISSFNLLAYKAEVAMRVAAK